MRFYYGAFRPGDLTLGQYFAYLDRIGDIQELESGDVNHRSKVARMVRRKKRFGL